MTPEIESFVSQNLTTLCKECLDWQESGLLVNGKLRELAQMCKEIIKTDDGKLRLAQNLVNTECYRFVVARNV